MYTIDANTCSLPPVNYTMRVKSPEHALAIANILVEGFNSVKIIDNETGEVMFSVYGSDSFFKLFDMSSIITTPETAFQNAMQYYEENNC